MEIILGTASDTLVFLEKGRCALTDACFKSGICNSRSQVCECLQGQAVSALPSTVPLCQNTLRSFC